MTRFEKWIIARNAFLFAIMIVAPWIAIALIINALL